MTAAPALHPTLWRTCRVLANRTRLRVFGLLVRQSAQPVSAVAWRLQLPLPVASQSLRALEARGLLTVRRVGRRVQYRLNTTTGGAAPELVAPLRSALRRGPWAMNSVFRLSTAFTHPRRIEIYRVLKAQARTLGQVQAATRISVPALLRHLGKLKARGFVGRRGAIYSATKPPEGFGRALARLAAG
jgi:DNA-binding transcriptional ArsR family regulator